MNDHVASTPALAVSIPRRHLPLRSRLLLASALVQLVMLGLLIYNGIGVLEDKLITRARIHLEDQKQLLSAVVTAPLLSGDEWRVQEVLDRVRRGRQIVYIVMHDRQGRVIAASGWNPRQPLPPREAAFTLDADVFHTEVDVQIDHNNHGKLAIGLDTRYLKTARSELIREDLALGVLLLLLSSALTVGVAYWLKRSLSDLTRASTQIAAGDLSVRLAARGNDEVAQLTKAFNLMAAALKNRIDALAESEAKFNAIADYSYDCELWISARGKLVWINPRVRDM
ncbi:MAG: HAMP domain-containing protein, partial [Pseudomonadota bacterium]